MQAPQKIVENVKIKTSMVSMCTVVGCEEELHARLIIDYAFITFARVKYVKHKVQCTKPHKWDASK